MATIRPLRALRYSPHIDLSSAICPPFDTISPQEQQELHRKAPYNAVRLELPLRNGDPYLRAAETLHRWLEEDVLLRDPSPAFYLHRQEFRLEGRTYRRLHLLARLRLEPWERGIVRPHEQTFSGPKEDRLRLLRATRVNTSPVFLLYRDSTNKIHQLLRRATAGPPLLEFQGEEEQSHLLWRLDDPDLTGAIPRAFAGETLYLADGHHRFETALSYREEVRAASPKWSEDRPENFTLAALTSVEDPGLIVLPIHRLINAGPPLEVLLGRLQPIFDVEALPSPEALLAALAERGRQVPTFGLTAADSPDLFLVTLHRPQDLDPLLPQDRSPAWRRLDPAIATYGIIRHGLGLEETQMGRIDVVWYSESAREAIDCVRQGRCRYALLLNPVPARTILALADAGERMPQKSTFFYPKLPTGLLFNPLED